MSEIYSTIIIAVYNILYYAKDNYVNINEASEN